MDEKKKINMFMPEALVQKIDAERAKIGLNRTQMINMIISQYFENKENLQAIKSTENLLDELKKMIDDAKDE